MPIVETYTVQTQGVGLPDYSQAKPEGQVPIGSIYTSTDVGELAPRLGGVNTYDRRGNIIWKDDFEDGVNQWTEFPLAGYSWSSDRIRNGGFSLAKLYSAAANHTLTRVLPNVPLGRNGMESSFAWGASGGTFITLRFRLFTGTLMLEGAVRYHNGLQSIYYLDANNVFTLISANILSATTFIFNTMKVVVDFSNALYMRLLFNNLEFDISANAIYQVASALAPHMDVILECSTTDAGTWTMWWDDVIVTQNEPINT